MEAPTIAKFQFINFKIIKSYFEMGINQEEYTFSLDFSPKGIINKDKTSFELELNVIINEENNNFKAEITAVGTYTFDSEIDVDTLDKYFYVNAPALMFPYIRAYISALTTLSGLKSINMPTLNLTQIGPELKKNTVVKE
ncbi:Protein-export protein SecB [subsurface metagenome]